MTTTTFPVRWLGGLAVASLTFTLTALPAGAGTLEPVGDTALEVLDRDQLAVRSPTFRPGVRADAGAIRVELDLADPELVGPARLELETAITVGGTSGTVGVAFDGRFLTARDLTTDQDYRMEATSTFADSYTFELYRGGVRVAVADVDDGVAPFVLDDVADGELVHQVDAVPDGHGGQQIELHSWSLGGTWNATFDGGGALVVDHVVVRAHELGHLQTLRHDVGATTVHAFGAAELRAGVEDVIVPDARDVTVNAADVRSVFLLAAPAAAPRTTRFVAPTGYLVRLRAGRDGAEPGAWSAWSTAATLVSPAPAPASDLAVDDVELELQRAGAPTIRVHGYVKIKKLNSGG